MPTSPSSQSPLTDGALPGPTGGPKRLTAEQVLYIDQLRQHALQLINETGQWQQIEGYPGKLRGWTSNSLFMLHRTPFQPPPISEEAVAAGICAQTQRLAARQFGLDIWQDSRKVLCTIWNEGEEAAVVMCRRGQWEAELSEAHAALPH